MYLHLFMRQSCSSLGARKFRRFEDHIDELPAMFLVICWQSLTEGEPPLDWLMKDESPHLLTEARASSSEDIGSADAAASRVATMENIRKCIVGRSIILERDCGIQ